MMGRVNNHVTVNVAPGSPTPTSSAGSGLPAAARRPVRAVSSSSSAAGVLAIAVGGVVAAAALAAVAVALAPVAILGAAVWVAWKWGDDAAEKQRALRAELAATQERNNAAVLASNEQKLELARIHLEQANVEADAAWALLMARAAVDPYRMHELHAQRKRAAIEQRYGQHR